MLAKVNFLVIVALLLGLNVADAGAAACSKYTCKTSSQNFAGNQCGFEDNETDTYYLRKCANSIDICEPTGQNPYVWSCTLPYFRQKYPGEKCNINSDCDESCSNGVCTGTSLGGDCYGSYSCNPGLYCDNSKRDGVCAPLIAKDKAGCESDYDCDYNLLCDIVSDDYYSLNYCRAIGSYKPGKSLGLYSCIYNSSLLCSSGSCASITTDNVETFYCTQPLKSLQKLPIVCNNIYDVDPICNSNPDSTTNYVNNGTCWCGSNAYGIAYCDANPGDTVITDFNSQLIKWLSSSAVKKCNTVRKFVPDSLTCASDYYDPDDFNKLFYSYYRSELYIELYGSEDCVVGALYPDYWRSIEENSAILLAASALLLALA